MVILGLKCRSCGKLFDELYGNAVSDKSLARPSYSRDGVARGKHGFSSSSVLLLCCSRDFCGTISISERTVSQSAGGRVGGEALEARHTFFSAL